MKFCRVLSKPTPMHHGKAHQPNQYELESAKCKVQVQVQSAKCKVQVQSQLFVSDFNENFQVNRLEYN